jgi:hypothetical protein
VKRSTEREANSGFPLSFVLEDQRHRVDNHSMAVFPYQVGQLYNGGIQNGQVIYTQPGGIGTPVFPQPPQTSPPSNWHHADYRPIYPFSYQGLLNFICNHWTNTCEVVMVYNPVIDEQVALCCCPVCSMIQLIVAPASDWWFEFYSLFPRGQFQAGAFPTPNLV